MKSILLLGLLSSIAHGAGNVRPEATGDARDDVLAVDDAWGDLELWDEEGSAGAVQQQQQQQQQLDRALAVGSAAHTSVPTPAPTPPLVVQTQQGAVRGIDEGDGRSWYGVPFSAPPVGALRWRPPKSHAGWSGTRAAATPALCTQRRGGVLFGTEAGCNNANVWAPRNTRATNATAPLVPVMVWIHGGSFTSAAPSLAVYNGTQLVAAAAASDTPVIVASLQYRMGGLGFMAHRALREEPGAHGSSGNYGLLDQLAGLRWVQQNIEAFGGDPARVTIFGESAGAYSVCALLASPLATGLFAGAVAESAYCANGYYGAATAELSGAKCAAKNSCDGAGSTDGKQLACLRALPEAAAYGCDLSTLQPALQTLPNVDGYLLHDAPLRSIALGTTPDGVLLLPAVPIVFGSNKAEMTIFAFMDAGNALGIQGMTAALLPAFVRAAGLATTGEALMEPALAASDATGPRAVGDAAAAELVALYSAADYADLTAAFNRSVATACRFLPSYTGTKICAKGAVTNAYRRFIAQQTDQQFTSTAQLVCGAVAARGLRAHRYLFEQNATGNDLAPIGAFHGIDVPFVFGTFKQFGNATGGWAPPPELVALSRRVQQYWIAFAHTGDPNGNPAGGPASSNTWPPATASGEEYMELVAPPLGNVQPGRGFRAAQVAFWKQRAVAASNTTTPPAPTPKPTPAPTVSGAPAPITVANVMTGFTKDTFFAEYQLAFRTATAATLRIDLAKVTLGPITDVARRSRALADRALAETTSIKFDTIITLTKGDIDAAPTLLATVETAAKAMAADPTHLIAAFVTEQTNEGFANTITPTITSTTSAPGFPFDDDHKGVAVTWTLVGLAVAGMVLKAVHDKRQGAGGSYTPAYPSSPTAQEAPGSRTDTAGSATSLHDEL